MDDKHYRQKPRRRAEFIKLPNLLKVKVGSGGLSEDILDKAQALLENNTVDFQPLGEMYLATLMKGIELAKNAGIKDDSEYVISSMLYPAMQLKANGGMFRYQLLSDVADIALQFLEAVDIGNDETYDVIKAHENTIKIILASKLKGDGGREGYALIKELDNACQRYFKKYGKEAAKKEA